MDYENDSYDDYGSSGTLRYEHTLNRDITQTIERINRSQKFKGSAGDIFDIISPVLKNNVKYLIESIWKEKNKEHPILNNLSITVDIAPPVRKKVHPEGDTDKYFKFHKEYPFYYLFNLKVSIKFTPDENDIMKEDEALYSKWFIDNVSSPFSLNVLDSIKTELDKKFSNIFSFPLIEAAINREKELSNPEADKKPKTIEKSIKHTENRLNIIISPTIKFNKGNDEAGVNAKFDATPEIKEVLIASIALALERIIRV